MNAVTLHCPWAELISIGAKTIETRHWQAPPDAIGQPLAIHSGKAMYDAAHEFLVESDECRRSFGSVGISPWTGLPETQTHGFDWEDESDLQWLADRDPKQIMTMTRGCVVAVAKLIGCCRIHVRPGFRIGYVDPLTGTGTSPSDKETVFGDWSVGRFAWLLSDIVRLPEPIPARGYQAIWQWEAPRDICGRFERESLAEPADDLAAGFVGRVGV